MTIVYSDQFRITCARYPDSSAVGNCEAVRSIGSTLTFRTAIFASWDSPARHVIRGPVPHNALRYAGAICLCYPAFVGQTRSFASENSGQLGLHRIVLLCILNQRGFTISLRFRFREFRHASDCLSNRPSSPSRLWVFSPAPRLPPACPRLRGSPNLLTTLVLGSIFSRLPTVLNCQLTMFNIRVMRRMHCLGKNCLCDETELSVN